jgi:hypothetical protein
LENLTDLKLKKILKPPLFARRTAGLTAKSLKKIYKTRAKSRGELPAAKSNCKRAPNVENLETKDTRAVNNDEFSRHKYCS